jgi:hypothetical protein
MLENTPEVALVLLLVPMLGFVINMAAHALLARIFTGGLHVRIQFVSFGLGMVAVVSLLVVLLWQLPFAQEDRIGYLILHAMIYVCIGFGLFNVINANVSSLRVRMLKEYLAAEPAPLSDDVMFARYPASEILAVRLARLIEGQQIYTKDGLYFPRQGGVAMIGKFFAFLRRLLLNKP